MTQQETIKPSKDISSTKAFVSRTELWTCGHVSLTREWCVSMPPPERGTASDCQYDVKWQGRSLSKFDVALLFTFLSFKSALGSLIVPFDVCR